MLALTCALAAILAARVAAGLRFFGVYDSGFSHEQCPGNSSKSPGCGPSGWYGGSDPALQGWTNLAMSDASDAVFASRQAGRPRYQLLQLSDTLWNTTAVVAGGAITIRTDWRQRWQALLPTAQQLHQNRTIAGFFFGDELVGGGGLLLESLGVAATAVRAAFPQEDVILFENEAAHVFLWQPSDGTGGLNRWANFTAWPTALTHVSVDICETMDIIPPGHSGCCRVRISYCEQFVNDCM